MIEYDFSDEEVLELQEYLMELIMIKKIDEGKMVFSGSYSDCLN